MGDGSPMQGYSSDKPKALSERPGNSNSLTPHTGEVIDRLAQNIGEWAKGHGFWEGFEFADWLEEYAEKFGGKNFARVPEIEAVRVQMVEGAALVRTLTMAAKIALCHSELSEALETLRDHGGDGILGGEGNWTEELSDTFIRLSDLVANTTGGMGDVTIEKQKVNLGRPYKHGRKF